MSHFDSLFLALKNKMVSKFTFIYLFIYLFIYYILFRVAHLPKGDISLGRGPD